MRPVDITIGLTPADADGVCVAQTTGAAAELLLDGGALSATVGIARMATAQTVRITTAADESARVITITGKDALNRTITEKMAGPAATTGDFSQTFTEVSRIEIDGATTGNVSAGIAGSTQTILTTSTLANAAAFTLDGVWTYESRMFGVADNHAPLAVKVFSTGDNSGDTLTIFGQDENLVDISETMAGAGAGATATSTKTYQIVYAIHTDGALTGATYAGWASDVDGIAESQTISGAGYFVMNGAKCVEHTQARHLSITSAGSDESGDTFTVIGLDRRGDRITEQITGPTASATVKGGKNFNVIRAIGVSGALDGNVTVGSADQCDSRPLPMDYYTSGMSVGINHSPSSDLTHQFQTTLSNLFSGDFNEDNADWITETANKTTDEQLRSEAVVIAVRLEVTSHTVGVVNLKMAFPGRLS